MSAKQEELLKRTGAGRDWGETVWSRAEIDEEIRRRALEDAERAFEKVREQLERLLREARREREREVKREA